MNESVDQALYGFTVVDVHGKRIDPRDVSATKCDEPNCIFSVAHWHDENEDTYWEHDWRDYV